MQGGDIDNTPVPRVYIVWEGTIARRPEKVGMLTKVLGRSTPYVVDPEVRAHLWDQWQRIGVRFDAVTFDFNADDVSAVVERENLPINTVWDFKSREEFIQQLPRMPWVSHVVDHERPMAYGGRSSTLAGVRR